MKNPNNYPTHSIDVEGARLAFLNLEGKAKAGGMNPAGKRNFCLLIDDAMAESLLELGYNVKQLKAREEGDSDQPFLPIQVKYHEQYPQLNPSIHMIKGGNNILLQESDIKLLDWATIEGCDLTFRPYDWEMKSGDTGRTAYLVSMYVQVQSNRWEEKYSDVMDSGQNCVGPDCPVDDNDMY